MSTPNAACRKPVDVCAAVASRPRRAPSNGRLMRAAREEKLRTAFAPIQMVFSIDGTTVATHYVEGDGTTTTLTATTPRA
jgi:hypothetical protein